MGGWAQPQRADGSQTRRPAARTDRRPYLDGVEISRQHRLHIEQQGDGDVGEEVEAQQPLQAAPGAQNPHYPLAGQGWGRGCTRLGRRRGKKA